MKARFGRLLLVVALMLAQQAALAHQLWHAGFGVAQARTTVVANEPAGSSPQERLCDLHSALGAVLGVLNGSLPFQATVVIPQAGFTALAQGMVSLAAPAPASRDPPRLAQ